MSEHEHCLLCDDLTGRAGKGDDSLYFYDAGPFCQKCYDIISLIVKAAYESGQQDEHYAMEEPTMNMIREAEDKRGEEVLELALRTIMNGKIGSKLRQSYQERFGE